MILLAIKQANCDKLQNFKFLNNFPPPFPTFFYYLLFILHIFETLCANAISF